MTIILLFYRYPFSIIWVLSVQRVNGKVGGAYVLWGLFEVDSGYLISVGTPTPTISVFGNSVLNFLAVFGMLFASFGVVRPVGTQLILIDGFESPFSLHLIIPRLFLFVSCGDNWACTKLLFLLLLLFWGMITISSRSMSTSSSSDLIPINIAFCNVVELFAKLATCTVTEMCGRAFINHDAGMQDHFVWIYIGCRAI